MPKSASEAARFFGGIVLVLGVQAVIIFSVNSVRIIFVFVCMHARVSGRVRESKLAIHPTFHPVTDA